MDAFLDWFTAARRKAIYAALGGLTVLLVAVGALTDADAARWMDVGQKVLALLASLIAIVNLTPDEGDLVFDPEATDDEAAGEP